MSDFIHVDDELYCKCCGTHWHPISGGWTRRDVIEGNCPDCGYKGVPIKKITKSRLRYNKCSCKKK